MRKTRYSFLDYDVRSGKRLESTDDAVIKALNSVDFHGGLMDPDDPTHRHNNGLGDGRKDQNRGELSVHAQIISDSNMYFRMIPVGNNSEYHPAHFINELVAVVGGMFKPDTFNLRQAMLDKKIPEDAVDSVELAIDDLHYKVRSKHLRNVDQSGVDQMPLHEFVATELMKSLSSVFPKPNKIISDFSKEIWKCFDSYRGIVERFLNSLPGINNEMTDAILLRILQNAVTHPVFLDLHVQVKEIEKELLSIASLGGNDEKNPALIKMLRMGDSIEAMKTALSYVDKHDSRFKLYFEEVVLDHKSGNLKTNSMSM